MLHNQSHVLFVIAKLIAYLSGKSYLKEEVLARARLFGNVDEREEFRMEKYGI